MLFKLDLSKIGEKKDWEGSIEIDFPKYTQRLKYIQECQFKLNSDGEINISLDSVDSIIKMIEISRKHVKSVDVLHKKTGSKFAKFEDLEDFQDCQELSNVVAGKILGGLQLGEI